MGKDHHPWAVPVALEEIPDAGLHKEIDADAGTRAALARLAGVNEVAALSATFDLVRQGAGIHVSGRVKARVGQTCVVTLEPVENTIDEPVEVQFVPSANAAKAGQAIELVDEDEEPPEPLVDGKVDLGALATQFLVLGIDPYPRKRGAEFTSPAGAEAGDHPFAGLESLKKRLGGGNS